MSGRGRPVLVVTYWSYADALVQAYTLPYVRQIVSNLDGGVVYLVTLEQAGRRLAGPERARTRRELRAEGIHWIRAGYSHFGVVAALRAAALLVRLWAVVLVRRVRSIHCWCTPAGAFGYVLSLTTGRPLVLDSYEPHADLMVENGTWRPDRTAFRVMSWFERRQSRRAKVAIGVTESMRDYASRRYDATFERFYAKPACVDLARFDPTNQPRDALRAELGWSDKVVCAYAGKLGGIYFVDEFFAFVRAAWDLWGDRFRLLIMTDTSEADVRARLEHVGVPASVVRVSFEPHDRVARNLALADLAINPMKPVPSRRYSAPIKDGEYWAMGLPVVIPPGISDDSDLIASHRAGAVVTDFSVAGWTTGLLVIDAMLRDERHDDRVLRIRELAETYRTFALAERIYRDLYGASSV